MPMRRPLAWGRGLPGRQRARSCAASPSTVSGDGGGPALPMPDDLDDAALEARLYPGQKARRGRPEPDFAVIYRELKRKSVTLQPLWQDYFECHPENGYGCSCFCERYRQWRKKLDVTMRQKHRAGEKLFVDYAGPTIGVTDRDTEHRERALRAGDAEPRFEPHESASRHTSASRRRLSDLSEPTGARSRWCPRLPRCRERYARRVCP